MLSFTVRVTSDNLINAFDDYKTFRLSQKKTANNQNCALELIRMGLEAWEVGTNPDEMIIKIHEKSMQAIKADLSIEDALSLQIEDAIKNDPDFVKNLPPAQRASLINSRLSKPVAETIEMKQERKQLEELLQDLPDEHTVRKELMIAKLEMHKLKAQNLFLSQKNAVYSKEVDDEINELLHNYRRHKWTLTELERIAEADIKKIVKKLYSKGKEDADNNSGVGEEVKVESSPLEE